MFSAIDETTPARPTIIIGAAFGDVILHIDSLPCSGDDIPARDGGRQIGGCAFNIARALARLGLNPVAAIPVGNGAWGASVEREMHHEGLTVLLRHPSYDNGWCLAMVEASRERTFITIAGCEQYWTWEMLAKIPRQNNPLVYVSGYELASDILYQWIMKLRPPHTLFIDFGPRLVDMSRQQILALLQKSPLLTLNRDELILLCRLLGVNTRYPLEAANRLSQAYRLHMICRLDADGACVFEPGKQKVVVPARRVKVHDTIGAGDSHCAGVIAGLAYGMALPEATKLGNEVAAIVVSRPGASGSPCRDELLTFRDKTI